MESASAGKLVKVAGGGPVLDGIVFDTPGSSKVVVAGATSGHGSSGHARGTMHRTTGK